MTLFLPPRRMMSAPSACFVNSPFNMPKYVSKNQDREHIEVIGHLCFSPYDQLSFDALSINDDNIGGRTSRSKPTSTGCSELVQIRSILKKSRSVDSVTIDLKHNIINAAPFYRGLNRNEFDTDCSTPRSNTDDIDTGRGRRRAGTLCSKIRSSSDIKSVTFADDQNQDLVEVRTFVSNTYNVGILSNSPDLFNGFLMGAEACRIIEVKSAGMKSDWRPDLSVRFKEPYLEPDFMTRLATRFVSLEKCGTRNRLITGLVLVKNKEYNKRVFIRYTIDKWETNSDTDAIYLSNSPEGVFDRFTFTLNLPTRAREIEFAICYKTSTEEFWDNNNNKNYKVEDSLGHPS